MASHTSPNTSEPRAGRSRKNTTGHPEPLKSTTSAPLPSSEMDSVSNRKNENFEEDTQALLKEMESSMQKSLGDSRPASPVVRNSSTMRSTSPSAPNFVPQETHSSNHHPPHLESLPSPPSRVSSQSRSSSFSNYDAFSTAPASRPKTKVGDREPTEIGIGKSRDDRESIPAHDQMGTRQREPLQKTAVMRRSQSVGAHDRVSQPLEIMFPPYQPSNTPVGALHTNAPTSSYLTKTPGIPTSMEPLSIFQHPTPVFTSSFKPTPTTPIAKRRKLSVHFGPEDEKSTGDREISPQTPVPGHWEAFAKSTHAGQKLEKVSIRASAKLAREQQPGPKVTPNWKLTILLFITCLFMMPFFFHHPSTPFSNTKANATTTTKTKQPDPFYSVHALEHRLVRLDTLLKSTATTIPGNLSHFHSKMAAAVRHCVELPKDERELYQKRMEMWFAAHAEFSTAQRKLNRELDHETTRALMLVGDALRDFKAVDERNPYDFFSVVNFVPDWLHHGSGRDHASVRRIDIIENLHMALHVRSTPDPSSFPSFGPEPVSRDQGQEQHQNEDPSSSFSSAIEEDTFASHARLLKQHLIPPSKSITRLIELWAQLHFAARDHIISYTALQDEPIGNNNNNKGGVGGSAAAAWKHWISGLSGAGADNDPAAKTAHSLAKLAANLEEDIDVNEVKGGSGISADAALVKTIARPLRDVSLALAEVRAAIGRLDGVDGEGEGERVSKRWTFRDFHRL